MEKTQFLCVFFCRNIIRNVLLFCAVRVIYVLPKEERRVHIMKNEIRFTLESKQRPKLAQEIGNILGTAPHYERVPSCAYDIAGYRLDKEGVLHIPEGAEETAKDLILQLRERGFQDDAEITEEVTAVFGHLTVKVRLNGAIWSIWRAWITRTIFRDLKYRHTDCLSLSDLDWSSLLTSPLP